MTLSLKSPVFFAFLLMIVPFADQYILKVIPFFTRRYIQVAEVGKYMVNAFNFNKCKLLCITYRKSSVIKYVYNMYQANALSDNNSPLLALLAKIHLGFAVPSTDFIHIKETQHESYLGVIIDNELNLNQHIDDMSKKATNLLNLCHRNLRMCSKEVKNSAYSMIVRPNLEYASTCWNHYTERNIDKLEAVKCRDARFVLNFMITIQLPISVVKSRNLYNGIHCNIAELLQICVCSIN